MQGRLAGAEGLRVHGCAPFDHVVQKAHQLFSAVSLDCFVCQVRIEGSSMDQLVDARNSRQDGTVPSRISRSNSLWRTDSPWAVSREALAWALSRRRQLRSCPALQVIVGLDDGERVTGKRGETSGLPGRRVQRCPRLICASVDERFDCWIRAEKLALGFLHVLKQKRHEAHGIALACHMLFE